MNNDKYVDIFWWNFLILEIEKIIYKFLDSKIRLFIKERELD